MENCNIDRRLETGSSKRLSEGNYHYSLRNNPEERICQDHTSIAHMMSQCVRSRGKKMFVVTLL